MGYYDELEMFPRRYDCMGHAIAINREASWTNGMSTQIIYERLAQQLSLIDGVQAVQMNHPETGFPDGLYITIDASVVADFSFIKKTVAGDWLPELDRLRVVCANGGVRVSYGESYIGHRVRDKNGVLLGVDEADVVLPLTRFRV